MAPALVLVQERVLLVEAHLGALLLALRIARSLRFAALRLRHREVVLEARALNLAEAP